LKGALFLWFSSCFVFSPGTWRWTGYELLGASILQTISFVWFSTGICHNDGNTCDLFLGSYLDIAAATLWLVSAVTIFVKYPPPIANPNGGNRRKITETNESRRNNELSDDEIIVPRTDIV